MALLLAIMDTSIVATSIYTIAIDFDSLAKAIWVVLAYTLCYLGFAAIFARLSDFVGRRAAVVSAFICFISSSIGGGFAQTIDQLIVCRALQGFGGAGLYAMSIILMIECSTYKLLPLTSSLAGSAIAMAGVLGPIVGGLLTTYASWRWVLWINAPAGVVACAAFVFSFPSVDVFKPVRRPFWHFDGLGAFLLLAASVMTVFGLQEAGSGAYAWNSATVLGTLIAGVISWVLLFVWEFWAGQSARFCHLAFIFPIKLLTNRVMAAAIL